MSRPKGSPIERFWARVERAGDDECWLWTGPIRGWGYGGFYFNCEGHYAHRWLYQHLNGITLPDKLYVLHRCDVRRCVNPAHLFVGTHLDNMADMVAKGRSGDRRVFGVRNAKAKLTPEKVREIRRRYAAGESQEKLAGEFGVSQPNVGAIVNRETWVAVT